MPDGGWRGWADLLAEAVGAELHNLASSGAARRRHDQLPAPRPAPGTYDRRTCRSIDTPAARSAERGPTRLLAPPRLSFDLVAAQFGVPVERRPDPEPANPEPTVAAKAWWMATRGTKWLIDRSTDLVPSLLRLALAEARDGSPPAVVVSDPLVVSPVVSPFCGTARLPAGGDSIGWAHGSTRWAHARPTTTRYARPAVEHASGGLRPRRVRRRPGYCARPASPRVCRAGARAPGWAG